MPFAGVQKYQSSYAYLQRARAILIKTVLSLAIKTFKHLSKAETILFYISFTNPRSSNYYLLELSCYV